MKPAVILLLPLLTACEQEFDVHAFEAEIEITPEVTDLGAVPVGTSNDFGIHAVHIEGDDVDIMSVDVLNIDGSYFSFDSELPTVVAGDMAEITLTYAPEEIGYHWAEVTVLSDSVEERITVTVRGQAAEAAAAVYPPLVDFGPVEAGASTTSSFFLVNEGQATFILQDVSTNLTEVEVLAALPKALAQDEEFEVELAFTATHDAPVTGAAELSLNAADLVLAPVALAANDCENGDATLYDADADGYGVCGTDCDDAEDTTHPGAEEWYDGVDQDCDGIIDEGTEGYDDDGDGYTELEGDCNDGDTAVYPGAPEDYSNGIDDDCDGGVDSNFADNDNDGYAPEGGDCDDNDASSHPGAAEILDSVDNDCDGTTDEGTAAYDDDGDG